MDIRRTEIEPVYTGGIEGQRRAKRGETGSCCVRGGRERGSEGERERVVEKPRERGNEGERE